MWLCAEISVTGLQLCVCSVVMKSVELTFCVFLLPVQLPPSALKMTSSACTTQRLWAGGHPVNTRERESSRGGCTILYLWSSKQPWVTTWDSREVRLPQTPPQSLRLSHTQDTVTNTHPHKHQQRGVRASYLKNVTMSGMLCLTECQILSVCRWPNTSSYLNDWQGQLSVLAKSTFITFTKITWLLVRFRN